jgi:hypothetical protein
MMETIPAPLPDAGTALSPEPVINSFMQKKGYF